VLRPFEPVFSGRVWPWATTLLVGAILAPGPRTVAAALRVLGLQEDRSFVNYHRVLNRPRWSSRARSAILLRLLVPALVADPGRSRSGPCRASPSWPLPRATTQSVVAA
jgi:hypothetical protein